VEIPIFIKGEPGIFKDVSSCEKCFIEMLLPPPARRDMLGEALSWVKPENENQQSMPIGTTDFNRGVIKMKFLDKVNACINQTGFVQDGESWLWYLAKLQMSLYSMQLILLTVFLAVLLGFAVFI